MYTEYIIPMIAMGVMLLLPVSFAIILNNEINEFNRFCSDHKMEYININRSSYCLDENYVKHEIIRTSNGIHFIKGEK